VLQCHAENSRLSFRTEHGLPCSSVCQRQRRDISGNAKGAHWASCKRAVVSLCSRVRVVSCVRSCCAACVFLSSSTGMHSSATTLNEFSDRDQHQPDRSCVTVCVS
jgi:hypothetical protein